MTMFGNTRLYPNTETLARAGHKLPSPVSVPLVEAYEGTFRAADGESVSVISSPLQRHNQDQKIDLDLYTIIFGDRLVMWEAPNHWKETGELPQTISTSLDVEEIGIIVDLSQHCADETLNKWVTNTEYHGPMGKLGKYLSKAETLRQAYLNLKQSQEYQGFVKFLKSKGYSEPVEIERIAVGFLPANAAEGVSADHKTLFVNKEYAKLIREWAEYYGVDPEELHEYIIAHHQTTHRAGVEGTTAGERELEALIAEFFEGLAKKESLAPTMIVRNSAKSQREKYLRIARKIAGRRYDEVAENYGSLFQGYFKAALEEGLDEEEAFDYALEKVAEQVEKDFDEEEPESGDSGEEAADKDSDPESEDSGESDSGDEGSEADSDESDGGEE